MDVRGQWRAVAAASGLLGADGQLRSTIFAEMSALAARTGAINLGQGFPDSDGPPQILDAAVHAIRTGQNQYPPGMGIPALREAIAAHQYRFYGLSPDPEREILVTAGATEALAATILALCQPGDEVIVFEPYYDAYPAAIALAGATARVVSLSPAPGASDAFGAFGGFRLRAQALTEAIGPRTRAILLNNPHNPTGRVFTDAELEIVIQAARQHDLLVICDEVYEHLTFDGRPHHPLAAAPGMAERTITISSAGKTFSVTGWKVGWVIAPAELITAITVVKQFLTYVNAGPFQPAVAAALALPDQVYAEAAAKLQAGRDVLSQALTQAGLWVYPSEGTYFVVADASALGVEDGLEFCRRLPDLIGVVAVPLQVFYQDASAGLPLLRFACCKRPEVLAEAATRLSRLQSVL